MPAPVTTSGPAGWLRTALRKLDDEARHTAADDPVAARLVVARVLDAVAALMEPPSIGRPGRVPGTRELEVLKPRCVAPHRVHREVIEILRVFHTLRRLPRSW